MNPHARIRLIWIVAALTAAYAFATTLVFFVQDTFTTAWFVASLLVYGALLVLALLLAWADRLERLFVGAAPDASSPAFSQDVIYRTRTGQVVRTRYGTPAHPRSDYLAITSDETLPIRDLEARMDGQPPARVGDGFEAHVDEALARRAAPPGPTHSTQVNP